MSIVYFVDGFVPEAAAQIPITTHALHYGTSVFEGIRAYGDGTRSALFRPLEHFERFLRNAAWLEMKPRWTAAELTGLTVELLRRNAFFDDRYVRPFLFKTSRTIGAGLPEGESLAIVAVPMARGPLPRPGVTATWSRWRRFPAAACPAGAKIAGLYVNSSLARGDAVSRGFDQPILLDISGRVAEGYGANLFAVFGSHVTTPPADCDILPGITRDSLLQYVTSQADLSVAIEAITPDRLLEADEVFLCGTGMEIVPIASIEGRPIGSGDGQARIAERAARWYRDIVTGDGPAPDDWLVPVTPAT